MDKPNVGTSAQKIVRRKHPPRILELVAPQAVPPPQGIHIGHWIGGGGMPWDVVLLALTLQEDARELDEPAGRRAIPAFILRPRPFPRVDMDELDQEFQRWQGQSVGERARKPPDLQSRRVTFFANPELETPWPTLPEMFENLLTAVGLFYENAELLDDWMSQTMRNALGRVHARTPWLLSRNEFLAAAARDAAGVATGRNLTEGAIAHAAMRRRKDRKTRKKRKRVLQSDVELLRATAYDELLARHPGQGRAIIGFLTGDPSERTLHSQSKIPDKLYNHAKGTSEKLMVPYLVPLVSQELAGPGEKFATQAPLRWLSSQQGREALMLLFDGQVDRLRFHAPAQVDQQQGDARSRRPHPLLSAPGEHSRMVLLPLDEENQVDAPYLRWLLWFRGPPVPIEAPADGEPEVQTSGGDEAGPT